MKIGYSDFVLLCKVNDPDTWCGWLSVRADGVYVKVPDEALNLTAHERAVLTEHPTGNLSEPALRFPCSLKELRQFLEANGVYGCIDPFDMADWMLGKSVNAREVPASHENMSKELKLLIEASEIYWGSVERHERDSHDPNAKVAAWFVEKGFSSSRANSAASIIRPEWVPKGRKPEK